MRRNGIQLLSILRLIIGVENESRQIGSVGQREMVVWVDGVQLEGIE